MVPVVGLGEPRIAGGAEEVGTLRRGWEGGGMLPPRGDAPPPFAPHLQGWSHGGRRSMGDHSRSGARTIRRTPRDPRRASEVQLPPWATLPEEGMPYPG